jgi:hypothetical protein
VNRNVDIYTLLKAYPADSPAWSLVDAFDAVTNGIENPEALVRMESLTEPSLRPWKFLVGAIKALYDYDLPRCTAAYQAIDDDSAPGVLKPFFRAWIARQKTRDRALVFREISEFRDPVVGLYRRILMEPHPLTLAAEQAEEALHHGLYEQFETLALRVLAGLRAQVQNDGPLLALRYALYCLDMLDKNGYEGTDFFSALIRTLGEADGFCVLGFALIGKDNGTAAGALQKALDAGDGNFLDAPMRSLIGELILLLDPRQKGRTPVSGALPLRPGRRQGRAPATRQPELFEEGHDG